ncbi:MAG TPA: hypothetical protein VJ652_01840 [Noviherbaspirillum sp.]|nr:hypothetical protein [Noviherbaspirillum sp.]
MKKQLLRYALLGSLSLHLLAAAAPREFSFGVISPPHKAANESMLREALEQTDSENLAFVVVNGIKSADEPCSDRLYNDRKALLDTSKNRLIVSPAASDWATCVGGNGKSSAYGRLSRLRDLFFSDDFAPDSSRMAMVRQSAMVKFRSYAENARWEMGNIMFATLNLPRNNNHYVTDAGRNSEFEDRLVANRDWLRRVYMNAARKKMAGVVLFCDGNPLAQPASSSAMRDGFAETRRYLTGFAAKFPGKTLLIHNAQAPSGIPPSSLRWRRNLGELALPPGALKLTVRPSSPALFGVENIRLQASSQHQ